MTRNYSTSSLCSATKDQISCNCANVVMNGTWDDVLVIWMVILNWLLLQYVIMQQLWWNISWQPSLALIFIGKPWTIYCGDIKILPASGYEMVSGMTTNVSSPLSSTKCRWQSPFWVNLITFPLKTTTHLLNGRKFFIIDGSVHILRYHIVSIPTSTYSVSKVTLVIW